MRHSVLCLIAAFSLACAVRAEPPRLSLSEPLVLPGSDGQSYDIAAYVAQSRLTVLVFYSQSCPCLRVHESRLRALASDYGSRGVTWLLVDSEVGADARLDALEARRRAYPFPLLTDRGARLAKAVGAEFATHAVVVDASGHVRYSGGLDSDKNQLHAGARPYLRRALDALLAGREPDVVTREPLGCALELD